MTSDLRNDVMMLDGTNVTRFSFELDPSLQDCV